MQLDVGSEPYLSKAQALSLPLATLLLQILYQSGLLRVHRQLDIGNLYPVFQTHTYSWDMNYCPVWILVMWQRQTDRKWRIWAHRAICTSGLKNQKEEKSQISVSYQKKDADAHQGSHQSVRFKSPDFPWHFSVIFPDFPWPHSTNLTSIENKSKRSGGKICTYIKGCYKNMPRNIWNNLVYLSQIKIPWLSLTLDKNYWNSLTFQKENIFPDFPWRWQPWCKLQQCHTINGTCYRKLCVPS